MPAVTVKNIPDDLYENLKLAAKVNHRSINSEIIACLEKELLLRKLDVDSRINKARRLRNQFKLKSLNTDEIETMITEGRP